MDRRKDRFRLTLSYLRIHLRETSTFVGRVTEPDERERTYSRSRSSHPTDHNEGKIVVQLVAADGLFDGRDQPLRELLRRKMARPVECIVNPLESERAPRWVQCLGNSIRDQQQSVAGLQRYLMRIERN